MAKKMPAREIKMSPDQLVSLYQNQKASMDSLLQQERSMLEMEAEIIGAQEALKEIRDSGKKVNTLFLLGSGIFVEATVSSENVKSEVGGGVVRDVSIKTALEQLSRRKKNLETNLSRLRARKQELAVGLSRLESILQQYQSQLLKKNKTTQSVS